MTRPVHISYPHHLPDRSPLPSIEAREKRPKILDPDDISGLALESIPRPGITTDIQRRLREHQLGLGARRLRGRGPLVLAFSQAVGNRSQALRLEYRVKRLGRAHKEALITGAMPLPDLAD